MIRHPETLDDRDKVTRFITMMNTAAKDAANIVSRLREFYRQRDEGEIFFSVNVNQLVEQTISLTHPKWKAQTLANGITINIKTDLHPVPTIAGNEAELREVLTNLIFNAVDAMPDGGAITLRTHSDANRVILEVSDTGVGMTNNVQDRCLEPFFSTKGDMGTGLGLAVVFGIIQRHEGTIRFDSEPEQGTNVIIHLPVLAKPQAEKVAQESSHPIHPLHVLLVDDEPLVRESVAAYLTIDGHTVETATNGREGLEKFHTGRFDVVVVDWAMPEMSGDQLAAAIKQIAPTKPIILITGFGQLNEGGKPPEGVDCVVSKPITWVAFQEALASVKNGENLYTNEEV
jgi:CheY-like chemotaxis protein